MRLSSFALILVALIASSVPTQAALIFNIFQSGSDVIATASGSVNLSALAYQVSGLSTLGIRGGNGQILLGGVGTGNFDLYFGINTPVFGSSTITAPNSGIGDAVALNNLFVQVPVGYISGTALANTSVFSNRTLAGMGLIVGTYTVTWGSGASADSATINIGVPEPSTLLLTGLAAAGMLWMMRRRSIKVCHGEWR